MKIEEFEELKAQSVGHSIIKAGRLYREYSFKVVKEGLGSRGEFLRPSHFSLFPHIPFEGTTIVELARKMDISKQAVSVLVNELLDKKVLKKHESLTDKRSFIVRFNHDSKFGIFKGMEKLVEMDREIEEILGKKKSTELNKMLIQLIEHIK